MKTISNDFVSRYQLVKHLIGVYDGWRIPFGTTIEDEIINFPASEVMPLVHGTKIDIANIEDWVPWCKCSVCGYDGLFAEDNYCSNCGAKLDGGNNNAGNT